MGVTRVDVLEFTDGIKVMFTNKDRKNHWLIPSRAITISNASFYEGTKYFFRQMKITYEQWKNRWAA